MMLTVLFSSLPAGYLFGLDVAPLILATLVWVIQWPAKLLDHTAEDRGLGAPAGSNNINIERVSPTVTAKVSYVSHIRTVRSAC